MGRPVGAGRDATRTDEPVGNVDVGLDVLGRGVLLQDGVDGEKLCSVQKY